MLIKLLAIAVWPNQFQLMMDNEISLVLHIQCMLYLWRLPLSECQQCYRSTLYIYWGLGNGTEDGVALLVACCAGLGCKVCSDFYPLCMFSYIGIDYLGILCVVMLDVSLSYIYYGFEWFICIWNFVTWFKIIPLYTETTDFFLAENPEMRRDNDKTHYYIWHRKLVHFILVFISTFLFILSDNDMNW